MGTVLTEGLRPVAFIVSEAGHTRSRDNITLLGGAVGRIYKPGQVLGKITATGKFQALDPAASSGAEVAAAVCLYPYDATAADVKGAAITDDAELIGDALIWPDGISDVAKAAAVAQLRSPRGIKIRPNSYT